MSPLVLVSVDREDLVDEILARYQLACGLRTRLDATPRWRKRKRRYIDRMLRDICTAADRIRARLCETSCEEGMYEMLERAAARQREPQR